MASRGNSSKTHLSFGKIWTKLGSEKGKVTFNGKSGVDEAKEELKEVNEFLKDPQKIQKSAERSRKGSCW
jgi:ATP-dependent Zn protease